MKSIFSNNIELLGKVMDLHQERQNVVMSNLANLDVPAFKARRLEFEQSLQAALNTDARGTMTRTADDHLPAGVPCRRVHRELDDGLEAPGGGRPGIV